MEMLDKCARSQGAQGKDDFRLDSTYTTDGNGFEFMWIDYYSLRPNVREWDPELVVELVRRIGKVAALLDEKASPHATDRVALASEFGLAQVVAIVNRRCRGEFAEADHASAIDAHVEVGSTL